MDVRFGFWRKLSGEAVLEKTLESPLDCKEIQPVHPKGKQSWIFIEGLMLEQKLQYFGHVTWRTDSLERPWCWERLKAGERDDRGRDGWMASPTWWTWVWVGAGVGDGQGSLACCSPWGRKESDMTEGLNWTESKRQGDLTGVPEKQCRKVHAES